MSEFGSLLVVDETIPENARVPGGTSQLAMILKWNREGYDKLISHVEQGVTDSIAAQSNGVDPRTFYLWFAKGRAHSAEDVNSVYRQFYDDVSVAKARARSKVERVVVMKEPLVWLRSGPGSTIEGHENWSGDMVSIAQATDGDGPIDDKTMSEALCVLEELGMLKRTDAGQALFGQPETIDEETGEVVQSTGEVVEGEVDPESNGEDSDDSGT